MHFPRNNIWIYLFLIPFTTSKKQSFSQAWVENHHLSNHVIVMSQIKSPFLPIWGSFYSLFKNLYNIMQVWLPKPSSAFKIQTWII